MIKNIKNSGFTVDINQFYFDADVIKINKYLSGNDNLIKSADREAFEELQ